MKFFMSLLNLNYYMYMQLTDLESENFLIVKYLPLYSIVDLQHCSKLVKDSLVTFYAKSVISCHQVSTQNTGHTNNSTYSQRQL